MLTTGVWVIPCTILSFSGFKILKIKIKGRKHLVLNDSQNVQAWNFLGELLGNSVNDWFIWIIFSSVEC